MIRSAMRAMRHGSERACTVHRLCAQTVCSDYVLRVCAQIVAERGVPGGGTSGIRLKIMEIDDALTVRCSI